MLPAGQTQQSVTWLEPTATDNDGQTPRVFRTHVPGQSFAAGVHTVSYQFTDQSGNTAVCSFDIIVTITSKWVYMRVMKITIQSI